MPPALVAQIAAGSTTSNGFTTSAITTTGADLLVAAVVDYDSVPQATLSDSKGNTWTPRTTYVVGLQVRLFYSPAAIVGTGHTFTVTSAAGFPSLCLSAWSGLTSTPYDVESGSAILSTTSIQPGSITPPANGELLITALGNDPMATGLAITLGFTIVNQVAYLAANHFGVAMAYLIQPTAAAINPTWSWSGAGRATTAIAGFRAAVSVVEQRYPYRQQPWRIWRT